MCLLFCPSSNSVLFLVTLVMTFPMIKYFSLSQLQMLPLKCHIKTCLNTVIFFSYLHTGEICFAILVYDCVMDTMRFKLCNQHIVKGVGIKMLKIISTSRSYFHYKCGNLPTINFVRKLNSYELTYDLHAITSYS